MADQPSNEQELLAEVLDKSYPSNAKKPIRGKPVEEEKKIERIVSGEVTHRKKGFGKRLTGALVEDDTTSVLDYIVHDVLIPAAKSMITDMVSGGIEMLLFGSRRNQNVYRDRGRSYTSYNTMSNYRTREIPSRRDRETRDISRYSRATHDFEEIIIPSRGEAEEVLDAMTESTIKYGEVSVADFYEMVGVTSTFQDNKYGWTNLRGAYVKRTRGGYVIELPRTQPLE